MKSGLGGSSIAGVQRGDETDAVDKALASLTRYYGTVISVLTAGAALSLFFPLIPPEFWYVDFLFYTLLAVATVYFGISWAIRAFRLAVPRETGREP